MLIVAFAAAPLAAAYDAEAERAIRLKTTRQLKEMLKALKIPFKSSATKEELRELALEKDALAKYEKRFPEKAKSKTRKAKAKRAGPDTGELMRMLDLDGDGVLTREEVVASGAFRMQGMDADMEGVEEMEEVTALHACARLRAPARACAPAPAACAPAPAACSCA